MTIIVHGVIQGTGLAGRPIANFQKQILADPGGTIPNGAAGLYLLGCICRRTSRAAAAIVYMKLVSAV